MKQLCIFAIRIYQWVVSPVKRWVSGGRGTCRYDPTCSSYAIHALQRHGFFKGITLTGFRILRCQPWGGFGLDRVPVAAPWKQIVGLRTSSDTWKQISNSTGKVLLVCKGRLVADADTAHEVLEFALQGSRNFEGGQVYAPAPVTDAEIAAQLSQHDLTVVTTRATS